MQTYKFKCEKCGYQTNSKMSMVTHIRRKFSCNKDYDNEILYILKEVVFIIDHILKIT
jgi:hypothetical protein